jgi:predicted double-glycine peptidase
VTSWGTRAAGLALAVGLTIASGPGVAAADPTSDSGMYGDPTAAAPYWHAQSLEDNCGAMSVADVVGEITGHEPTEQQILAVAEQTPSEMNPGTKIYTPNTGGISVGDLPVLLQHYGIKSETNDTSGPGLGALEQYLATDRKVIVYVNSAIIWDTSDQRTDADHFLVVTGIDANKNVVHLNDPGADNADEHVPAAAFLKAWQTGGYSSVVTAAA